MVNPGMVGYLKP